eukprot:556352-Pyramimonas_sp.AAC.1
MAREWPPLARVLGSGRDISVPRARPSSGARASPEAPAARSSGRSRSPGPRPSAGDFLAEFGEKAEEAGESKGAGGKDPEASGGGCDWDAPEEEQDSFLVQELLEWSAVRGAPDLASFFLRDLGPFDELSYPTS